MNIIKTDLIDLTVEDFHRALRRGDLSSRELTQWYLDRIEAIDRAGYGLNSIVTVNPNALAEAERLDALLQATGELSGPLHGVPVLVKDQAESKGIRTAFGSELFADYVPSKDAGVIERLRAAGAVILAKTTMCDFAAGWFSSSSRSGHTRNAYDPLRDSGGSSAGSGAGLSANLGLLAIGEDTGGSIRIPASFNNVYGLRVTIGLISRRGFSPLVHFQDTPGPMARTAKDLAVLLDVIAGYDPADPYTATAWHDRQVGQYAATVAEQRPLGEFSVGVLETAFGDHGERSREVNRVVRDAIAALQLAGATVIPSLTIDDLPRWIAETSVYVRQSRADITSFLSSRDAPVRSFDEVYATGRFEPLNDLIGAIADGPDDPDTDAERNRLLANQAEFSRLVVDLLARSKVDILVYPTVQVVPPTHQELHDHLYTALTFPTNTVIASQAGLPALSMPVGFTSTGLPVGLEVLAAPHAESTLLQFAAAWEKLTNARKAPNID
ncbi:amidase [Cryobacterium sp. M91]|uniref:amidase n=1 Tax=Cryobacterium sp. M91 TaxID=2048294 RepID=UPI000CE45ACD|nr:amidase [Cryobacterium sp. M91]